MSRENPIDVRDMRIVHETFRRAYAQSAQLVRANPAPSAGRVTFLADHCDFALQMLHHHHEGEDGLLYPLLVSRVPEQAAMIDEVEGQHRVVNDAIEAASTACQGWRARPAAETGEALAAALDGLNATLQPHLDDEESKVVPLAATVLTQEEWEAIGAHARATIPRNRMPVAFGMLLEPLDAQDRAFMKSSLPLPVRLLYGPLIQRPWRRYQDTLLHGT